MTNTIRPQIAFPHSLGLLMAAGMLIAGMLIAGHANAFSAEQKPWPFYVLRDTQPPKTTSDWPENEIDRFVWQKLSDNGLTPASQASKHQLVRRLYFDVVGLPPTPEQVDEFVNDQSDDAYSKLVDRLLDDSRYGERWARFWLDLARYADTAGYEGDPDMPHAWRYRDYVIDAFNKDKPYDLFIKEQIAGDEFKEIMGAGELPLPSAEQTVAMTFLRLAPFTEPRGDETRHEMLSEMTSTVGSVFLGLTVGCAKCHDHKHDEIPTADFYRMKAFFATVQIPPPERGDGFQIGGSLDAKFYREGEQDWATELRERLQATASSADDELAQLKEKIANRIDVPASSGAGFGIQVIGNAGNDYFFDQQTVNNGKIHWSIIRSNASEWTIATDGEKSSLGSLSGANRGKWFASLKNPQHVSIGQYTSGSGKPSGSYHNGKFAEVLIYNETLSGTAKTELDKYLKLKYQPTEQAVKQQSRAKSPPQSGLRFWLDAADLDADPATPNPTDGELATWKDKVAGISLTAPKTGLRPTVSTLGPNDAPAVEFHNDFLVGALGDADFAKNEKGTIVVVYSAEHNHEGYGFEVGGDNQFLTTFINPSAKSGGDPIDQLIRNGDPRITKAEKQKHEFLSTRDRFTKQHLKRLKPVAMSLRHSFGPPYESSVPVSRIMIRGEYDHPGDIVEPGFLSVIAGNQDPMPIRLDPFKRWPTRSRRMTLANWIASPENPMTARVMVNRLWHWHFGQGIVATPSDFGDLSGGPSNAKLLDWLAERFIKEKWSVKAIHRLILNSSTYRQSSAREYAAADEVDPDNRYLWKFNRRRLEAEAVRDNVLAVSGRLNPEQYGLPIFPPLPGDVTETVKYSESKWDTQYGPEGRKRSIYIYQQRTLTMPLMQTFDALVCDESRPRRQESVTSLQALAMYNSEFVNKEAMYFAKRVRKIADDDIVKQIETAFEIALGRKPTHEETEKVGSLFQHPPASYGAVESVDRSGDLPTTGSAPSKTEGLVALCRVLLNTSEFLYID